MLSFQPFGLRTPTGHCRLNHTEDFREGADRARVDVGPAIELSQFSEDSYRQEAHGRHLLAATGRDQLHVTDLRPSPPQGFVTATARLTGFHQWLTVTAHRNEVLTLGAGAERVSSLWLTAIVALREETMASDRPQWLWLLGLDDSQRVQLEPDGRIYIEEVPTGLNRLIDLVQKEMGLHFRSSAFDLLFNEDFDWRDAPPNILTEFLHPLRAKTESHAAQHSLAVVGLGPRLGELCNMIAHGVGMVPWSPRISAGARSNPQNFETWLLREAAEREVEGLQLTAAFAGAPLFLPAPGEALGEIARPAPEDSSRAGTASETATGQPSEQEAADASGERPSHRRRRRSSKLWRHHPRTMGRPRADDSSIRKVIFVLFWVLAVGFAGHVLVEQGTEHAREQQEYGSR